MISKDQKRIHTMAKACGPTRFKIPVGEAILKGSIGWLWYDACDRHKTEKMDEISALESLLRIEAQKSSAFATIIITMLGLERHGTPCMRCALRFAGVWDGQIYRASCVKLAAALSRVLPSPVSTPDPEGPPCPLCLGTLEGGGNEPLTKRFLDMAVDATRIRGYQLQGATLSLALALPYCMAFRDIACWECVKETAPEVARSTGNRFCEVKDALKAAVETPLAQALGLPVDSTAGTFKVTLNVGHAAVDLEDFETGVKSVLPEHSLGQGSKRSRKRRRAEGQGRGGAVESAEEHKCTKPMIDRIQALADSESGSATLAAWFKARSAVPSRAACTVKLAREPLFLKARYQKLSRQLPQSAWVVNGTRLGKGSVEEIVGDPIKEWCGGEAGGFMGAGREDMDVRMLGTGRPFLLQINDPRRVPTPAELPLLEKLVNDSEQGQDVIITQLTISDKAQIKAMHEAAEDKQKFYTCIVWLSRPFKDFETDVAAKLQPLKDLTIQQRTPVRVLHRRSPLVRPRVIHEMRCEPINNRFFVLHVRSSAGTYIKEFVHGDLGRTEPNVGSLLGCQADILQLDVTDVINKGEKR